MNISILLRWQLGWTRSLYQAARPACLVSKDLKTPEKSYRIIDTEQMKLLTNCLNINCRYCASPRHNWFWHLKHRCQCARLCGAQSGEYNDNGRKMESFVTCSFGFRSWVYRPLALFPYLLSVKACFVHNWPLTIIPKKLHEHQVGYLKTTVLEETRFFWFP